MEASGHRLISTFPVIRLTRSWRIQSSRTIELLCETED